MSFSWWIQILFGTTAVSLQTCCPHKGRALPNNIQMGHRCPGHFLAGCLRDTSGKKADYNPCKERNSAKAKHGGVEFVDEPDRVQGCRELQGHPQPTPLSLHFARQLPCPLWPSVLHSGRAQKTPQTHLSTLPSLFDRSEGRC